MSKKIAIVGAGITGLSSAYYLNKQDADLDITVFEAANRPGGKIQTYRQDGYTIELGPESYLGRKTIMTDIAHEIGLGQDLITNRTGKSYIFAKNKLYPIPGGAIMGIPTDIKPFVKTKLISPLGKLRAGLDLFKKPIIMPNNDISVGQFFRQRLGDEVLEHLIEPLIGGIYGTDIDRLSLMSTFPEFKEREEQYGSLIKGMKYEKEQRIKKRELYPGSPKGQFKQFRHGLSSFIEALADFIKQKGVKIEYHTPIKDILVSQKSYQLITEENKVDFDAIIVTTPHQTFMNWFSHDPAFDYFKHMDATSVATIVMAFDESNIENTYDGTGFVIARTSDTHITACTWTSKKWPFTTPEGKVLIRAYIGKPGDTVVADHTDDELVSMARKDLTKMMTFKGEPDFTIVNRLEKSMPQYHVGHIKNIHEIQSHIKRTYPRLRITGAPFEAVGLPDCISQAKKAADEIYHEL
ncbi:protoporphyrinogen oxidase [Staphylococcus lugdunensis]|uniref:protoporphyrinogen oxidase n=1 Tax=Staphylococcus lugdunensis TaxID=28035 RepID=UPI000A10DF77|nr:protoporphyrinogen oxidase [Staphylococcus lugdunensis]ARJ26701.1 protoporphyrinogen oxidase [Staphylococcus lugdunensis]MCH8673780.1 protoporphyrinogen oxidase [Staphylococcus lugdunensis]MCH8676245.1 protoporphyrinogen oxidase [Staphylococcus lugdunensis]MCI2753035.1 protoporphyrinogen oxidase [Staphylococcus lugdunensis]MCI2762870.1 protoporphyrinogen oxidase [Staphylococcus lugdunensis]